MSVMAAGTIDEAAEFYFEEELYLEYPDENYSCPICLCPVQIEPHLTACCGRHFCLPCIGRLRDESRPCPMCKESTLAIFLNKERQREIKQIRVRCPLSLPCYRDLLYESEAEDANLSSGDEENYGSSDDEECDSGADENFDAERESSDGELEADDVLHKDVDDLNIRDDEAQSTKNETEYALSDSLCEEEAGSASSLGSCSDLEEVDSETEQEVYEENQDEIPTIDDDTVDVDNNSENESEEDADTDYDVPEESEGVPLVDDNVENDEDFSEEEEASFEANDTSDEDDNVGGETPLCDWVGELGQIEKHITEVHGEDVLRMLTGEDDTESQLSTSDQELCSNEQESMPIDSSNIVQQYSDSAAGLQRDVQSAGLVLVVPSTADPQAVAPSTTYQSAKQYLQDVSERTSDSYRTVTSSHPQVQSVVSTQVQSPTNRRHRKNIRGVQKNTCSATPQPILVDTATYPHKMHRQRKRRPNRRPLQDLTPSNAYPLQQVLGVPSLSICQPRLQAFAPYMSSIGISSSNSSGGTWPADRPQRSDRPKKNRSRQRAQKSSQKTSQTQQTASSAQGGSNTRTQKVKSKVRPKKPASEAQPTASSTRRGSKDHSKKVTAQGKSRSSASDKSKSSDSGQIQRKNSQSGSQVQLIKATIHVNLESSDSKVKQVSTSLQLDASQSNLRKIASHADTSKSQTSPSSKSPRAQSSKTKKQGEYRSQSGVRDSQKGDYRSLQQSGHKKSATQANNPSKTHSGSSPKTQSQKGSPKSHPQKSASKGSQPHSQKSASKNPKAQGHNSHKGTGSSTANAQKPPSKNAKPQAQSSASKKHPQTTSSQHGQVHPAKKSPAQSQDSRSVKVSVVTTGHAHDSIKVVVSQKTPSTSHPPKKGQPAGSPRDNPGKGAKQSPRSSTQGQATKSPHPQTKKQQGRGAGKGTSHPRGHSQKKPCAGPKK